MKTIQEMLQELSQCIVTVSGEFRFRTNWNGGGKVPQPDLDVFDPNVPFCIENVGDVPASVQYNTHNTNIKISKDYKTWNDYTSGTEIELNPKDRVYIKSDYVLDESATPKFHFTNVSGTRLRARGNIASLIYGTGDEYITKYNVATQYCYNSMFDSCVSLIQAPDLPATTLADHCYYAMFSNCTSLTQAPELPATNLADYCYRFMFNGCASLTQAPELPAITLANACYNFMFKGCASLTQAPELPATTLTDYCYSNMFKGCASLTQAPELPAKTLVNSCYYAMFSGCNKLNYVKCLATDTSATECTTNWLNNVSSSGTFECDNKKYFTVNSPDGIPSGWTITEINPAQPEPEPEKPDLDTFDPNVPFCIENVGDVPVEIGLYNTGKSVVRSNCKISTNLKTWSDYNLVLTDDDTSNDIGKILLQNKGDRVYIKADSIPLYTYPYPYPHTQFKVFNPSESKKIRARGNIASLSKGTDDAYKTDYLKMRGIGSYCYYGLFKDCTSLIQAPELPATALASNCYEDMFYGCTSLTQAPELPATTLADYCYQRMFGYCASLTQAPELPATTLADYCYRYMFTRCVALINAPKLPATEMRYGCYEDMFYSCTSLTQAPELPAIIVKSYSYASMFQYCTSLTRAPELPATTLANSCYINIFYGCTSLTKAPELPATTLADYCYNWMFQGCTKLNYVKCLATDTSTTNCTKNWLSNVSATGTFECDNKKYFTVNSPDGIPSGWTITEINPDPPTPPVPEKPDLDTFDPNVPFCIENVGDVPVEIGLYNIGTEAIRAKRSNCKISTDLVTWSDYNILLTQDSTDPNISKITLSNKGDRIYIKADVNTKATGSDFTKLIVINQSTDTKIRARGNIASLTYGTDDLYKSKYLTIDNHSCYSYMFAGCTSLTQAPDLPATTLYISCYAKMFQNCANLKRAPELPATTLETNCYYWMFRSCKKLNYVKCLATDISAIGCTTGFLELVASTGDFYTPASTNWTTGEYGIPAGWTRHDIT